MQDAQKGQTSHPPNPGAPRRALSQARPQRVKGGLRSRLSEDLTLSLSLNLPESWQTFSAS